MEKRWFLLMELWIQLIQKGMKFDPLLLEIADLLRGNRILYGPVLYLVMYCSFEKIYIFPGDILKYMRRSARKFLIFRI